MDCSICSSMPFILRPPRNTICGTCYEGARNQQPLGNLSKWMTSMKEIEEDLNKKISFLSGLIVAFRDQIHTDIQLKPGNDGPSIPAHRALLVCNS
ncbi:hypothetical protein Golob_001980, partial [Gossypium lobatum]|nr:hypothetical protein [Gossypium lobatum]